MWGLDVRSELSVCPRLYLPVFFSSFPFFLHHLSLLFFPHLFCFIFFWGKYTQGVHYPFFSVSLFIQFLFNFLLFFLAHLAVLWDYSPLNSQGSFLLRIRAPDGVLWIEPVSTACKRGNLPTILSLQPSHFHVNHGYRLLFLCSIWSSTYLFLP